MIVKNAFEAGADDYIAKPVGLNALLNILHEWIK
jgi:DNA-binding response OmpR family regulator